MSTDLYALVALAARYWFVGLIVVILFRGWRMTVSDNRRAKLLREWMGQTGCIGELIANPGGKKRVSYPIPKEGVLGSAGKADVRIRHRDMRRAHAHFEQREGGLLVRPLGRSQLSVGDGFTGETVFLRDGDVLAIGRLKLMLVLFDALPEPEGEDEWFEVDPESAEFDVLDDWPGDEPTRNRARPAADDRSDGPPRKTRARPAADDQPGDTPRKNRGRSGGTAGRPGAMPAGGARPGAPEKRRKAAGADDDFFDEDTLWRNR